MPPNIADVCYLVCRVEDDGVYSCGHEHQSVAEAMKCLDPHNGSFIRACEAGIFRPLNNKEYVYYLEAFRNMSWRKQNGPLK
jgi:hypothetical protein